jgi:hypothetical protein
MKASRRKSLPQPLPRRGVFAVELNFVFMVIYSLKFLV